MRIDAFRDRGRDSRDIPDMFSNDGGADWNYGEAAAHDANPGKSSKPLRGKDRRATNKALRAGKPGRKK